LKQIVVDLVLPQTVWAVFLAVLVLRPNLPQ
jgi:hypothetical protein